MAFLALRVVSNNGFGTFNNNGDCPTPVTPGAQDDYAFFRSFVAEQAAKDPELASALAQLQQPENSGGSHQSTSSAIHTDMRSKAADGQGLHPQHAALPSAASEVVQIISADDDMQQITEEQMQKQSDPVRDAVIEVCAAVAEKTAGIEAADVAAAPASPIGATSPQERSRPPGGSAFIKPDFTRREIKSLRRLFPIQSPLVKSAAMLQGEYQLLDLLGRGAFGTAYKARHLASGALVCVKTVEAAAQQSAADVERQNREVAVLAALNHPNIIRYHDCFSDGFKLHIVMEWAEGGDMQGLISRHAKAGTRLTEEQLLTHYVQIVAALAHIHAAGVMHRDLKTSNILFSGSGLIKLADFGIAKVLDAPGANSSNGSRPNSGNGGAGALVTAGVSSGPMAQSFVGTPNYLAPEMINCEPYNQKADVWAMGCLLYEMAALRPAFKADRIPLVYRLIRRGRLSPLPSCYSPELKALQQQLMAKDPNDRPSSAQLMQHEVLRPHLERYQRQLQQLGLELPPLPTPPTGYSTSGNGSNAVSSSNDGYSNNVSVSGAITAMQQQQESLPAAAPAVTNKCASPGSVVTGHAADCWKEQQVLQQQQQQQQQLGESWSIMADPGPATGPALEVVSLSFKVANSCLGVDNSTRLATGHDAQPGAVEVATAGKPADMINATTGRPMQQMPGCHQQQQQQGFRGAADTPLVLFPTSAASTGLPNSTSWKYCDLTLGSSSSISSSNKAWAAQLHKCLGKVFKNRCCSSHSRSTDSSGDGRLTTGARQEDPHRATATTSASGSEYPVATDQANQPTTTTYINPLMNVSANSSLFGSLTGGVDKIPPLSEPQQARHQAPPALHMLHDAGEYMRHTLSTIISSNESEISSVLGQNSNVQDEAQLSEAAVATAAAGISHRINKVYSNKTLGSKGTAISGSITAERAIQSQPDAAKAAAKAVLGAVPSAADTHQQELHPGVSQHMHQSAYVAITQQQLLGHEWSGLSTISERTESRTTPLAGSFCSGASSQGPGVCSSHVSISLTTAAAAQGCVQQISSEVAHAAAPVISSSSSGSRGKWQGTPAGHGCPTLQCPTLEARQDTIAEAHQQAAAEDMARTSNASDDIHARTSPASVSVETSALQQEQLAMLRALRQLATDQKRRCDQQSMLQLPALCGAGGDSVRSHTTAPCPGGAGCAEQETAVEHQVAAVLPVAVTGATKLQHEQLQMMRSIQQLRATMGIRPSCAATPVSAGCSSCLAEGEGMQ